MTKKEVQKRVLQDGEPLDLDLFEWDEKTNTFSSDEDWLVLDFGDVNDCTFDTGPGCTFKTGYNCTFNTGSRCTFKTGPDCTFDTGSDCTFNTGPGCTFKTGSDCVVVRRDVYEVIELREDQKIKLNEYGEKGFTIIDEEPKEMIDIDGKRFSKDTIKEALKEYVD